MEFKNQEEYAQHLRDKTDNCVVNIAKEERRTYITPEDVQFALINNGESEVRLAVLEVMGSATGFGIEDQRATAFVAFEGKQDYKFSDEQLEKLGNVLEEGNKEIAALLEKKMDGAESEEEKAIYLEQYKMLVLPRHQNEKYK